MTTLSYTYLNLSDEEITETINIDLISRVNTSSNSRVTSTPLESGRSVVDHVTDEPTRFSISGTVSDSVESNPRRLWTTLQLLKSNRTLMTLTTELDTYEDLLIEGLNPTENFRTGKSLQVEMTLSQVSFVDLQVSEVSQSVVKAGGAADGRTAKVNKGVVNAENNSVG